MTFTLGATTNTAVESLALDDIDMDNSGVSDARLSFGASQQYQVIVVLLVHQLV